MSRGTILVVEKDAFYSSFYEKLLTRESYRVVHAESIEEGLRRYREQPCEVVISDMVLGTEDGLAFLAAVKAANPRQDVVMTTSVQSLRKAVEALKRGAADSLTKPVDGDELLLLLRTLIERQTLDPERSRLVGENVLFYEQLAGAQARSRTAGDARHQPDHRPLPRPADRGDRSGRAALWTTAGIGPS